MGTSPSLPDATNTVSLGDARAVAGAADRILQQSFGDGSFDRGLLHATFDVARRLFDGEHPGYLACDMPYHDLRHSLDTALVMARLIAGYQRTHRASAEALTPQYGLLGVLLGLLHDAGFIRNASEATMCGPQLIAEHESRSVGFAQDYLLHTSLSTLAPLSRLILTTRLAADLDALFAACDGPAVTLGCMLGSADLVSQISDRSYLERCYYHLYPELVIGGRDRVRTADGEEQLLYADGFDLLRSTPAFYDNIVRRRLDRSFGQVVRYLRGPPAGADPYAEALVRNVDRFARLDDARDGFLGPEPSTTTRNLAAAYRATLAERAP
jgi:hypothetical protein